MFTAPAMASLTALFKKERGLSTSTYIPCLCPLHMHPALPHQFLPALMMLCVLCVLCLCWQALLQLLDALTQPCLSHAHAAVCAVHAVLAGPAGAAGRMHPALQPLGADLVP